MKIYAYLRVSTKEQDVASQRLGVEAFAKGRGWVITQLIEEQISGKIAPDSRKLGFESTTMQPGDKLIVSELSRLGRSLIDVLTFTKKLTDKGIEIYCVKENLAIGNNDDPISKAMVSLLGLFAELERGMIRQRCMEGQQRAKSEGKHIGRPFGSVGNSKLDKSHEAIWDEWNEHSPSIAYLARKYKVSFNTMKRFIERTVK